MPVAMAKMFGSKMISGGGKPTRLTRMSSAWNTRSAPSLRNPDFVPVVIHSYRHRYGLVPGDPRVTLRPMFGNLAAFVNGNMFAGLFGEDLFVRLPDAEAAPIRKAGGRDFEPMAGHAMRGYVMVPGAWQSKPEPARGWIKQALTITGKMPAKKPTQKAAKKPAATKKKAGR